jgi:hypothetical protein
MTTEEKPALELVPAVVEAEAEKTPEPVENPLIDAFIGRFSDVRKPGILYEFLAKFFDHALADKITEDAKATFSGKSTKELLEARVYVRTKEFEMAERILAERKAEEEKHKADEQAKREAAKADKAAAKLNRKQRRAK